MVLEKSIAQLDELIKQVSSSITSTPNQQQQPKQPKQQAAKQPAAKQKAAKQPKQPAKTVVQKSSDPDIALFQYAQLVVARILQAEKHPNADSLFLLQIEIGNNETRTVVAGLFKYYKADELQNRLVCSILNLKPAKLAGIESEAMLLAGSQGENVKLLEPPANSVPGDRVFLRGEEGAVIDTERCPPKQWQKIVSKLKVRGGKPTFDRWELVTAGGDVTCNLPDDSEIH